MRAQECGRARQLLCSLASCSTVALFIGFAYLSPLPLPGIRPALVPEMPGHLGVAELATARRLFKAGRSAARILAVLQCARSRRGEATKYEFMIAQQACLTGWCVSMGRPGQGR